MILQSQMETDAIVDCSQSETKENLSQGEKIQPKVIAADVGDNLDDIDWRCCFLEEKSGEG